MRFAIAKTSSFMKKIITGLCFSFYLLLLLVTAGCEKNASDAVFGDPKVFMPQAQIAALRYNVPNTGIGYDSVTKNFQLTSDSVRIILGISRSGTDKTEGYSADVYANADTVNQMITAGIFPAVTSMVLPSDTYSLPARVTVPDGTAGTAFYLAINRAKLKTYAGKTVLLSVGVRNPTKYTVNTAINKVIVVINVTALNL